MYQIEWEDQIKETLQNIKTKLNDKQKELLATLVKCKDVEGVLREADSDSTAVSVASLMNSGKL